MAKARWALQGQQPGKSKAVKGKVALLLLSVSQLIINGRERERERERKKKPLCALRVRVSEKCRALPPCESESDHTT
jgi:hypothetical protein